MTSLYSHLLSRTGAGRGGWNITTNPWGMDGKWDDRTGADRGWDISNPWESTPSKFKAKCSYVDLKSSQFLSLIKDSFYQLMIVRNVCKASAFHQINATVRSTLEVLVHF